MSAPPIFLTVSGRTLNTTQIKWAGVKQNDNRVCIEFVTGGYTFLAEDFTLDEFNLALDQAMKDAAPY